MESAVRTISVQTRYSLELPLQLLAILGNYVPLGGAAKFVFCLSNDA